MVHGKNRIPYRIDRKLTGLAEPDYDATISFGLPIEPEDSQYGKYRTISSSGVNATLAGWIKPQLWSAASAWADLVPELDLEACSTTCARNEDKEIFWIEIDADCNHRAACVKGLPAFNLGLELEGRIVGSGLRMVFAPDTAAYVVHEWTDDPTKDREEVGDGRLYRWIDRVVVHEFGHTFGLADRGEALGGNPHYDPNYRGIMGD